MKTCPDVNISRLYLQIRKLRAAVLKHATVFFIFRNFVKFLRDVRISLEQQVPPLLTAFFNVVIYTMCVSLMNELARVFQLFRERERDLVIKISDDPPKS